MATMDNQQTLEQLALSVGEKLLAKGCSLVTAESCTGGWVAQCLTSVAGSSEWFDCGFVTYSNASKQQMLGVPEAVLIAQGAVSEAVAARMAEGALKHSAADWALSITGIAGPGGGSVEKPVGTVCFGCFVQGKIFSGTEHFTGTRSEIRHAAAAYAIAFLERCIIKTYGGTLCES